MWDDGADAAREGRTVWTAAGLLMGLVAACGAWASREGLAEAAPYGLILVATGLAAWFAARVTGHAAWRLRTAEARLRAAAEALPDGLVVCDRNDRIAFYNSRYPAHMTAGLRETLAVGKRFEEWLRDGVERGVVYHPEMGEGFLKRRLKLRTEKGSEHVHRIADGRWVRIRESGTPDGGRVLLTTDITEERHRAAQLRLLALAVEQAGDPVEITDAEHGFTYVNQAFETTTGYSRAEVLGREPQHVLSSGLHAPEFFAGMRRQLEAGRTWHGTIVNRHRDGHLIEQETTISPLRDEYGVITNFVAVKRDVTAERAQARALAASEARYRAVVDTQTEFIARVGADGYWTFMNGAAERYIGTPLEDMRAKGLRDIDLILPEDREAFERHMASITPEHPTSTVELRGRHPDGSVHWEHWTDTGIFDADGKLVEIQCVGREITDRKLAEAAREEAERLRLAALEAALDCYIGVDSAGNVVEFNAAAERTFGYARAEAIGQPMAELIIPPHLRADHLRGFARHVAGGGSDLVGRRIEVDAMRADGTVFPIEIVIVKGERGGDTIFIAYMRDLSERRAAERALAEREAQFRTIAESVPVGLVISEIDTGTPLYINPRARKTLGADADVETLMSVWEKPEQRDATAERDRRARHRPRHRGRPGDDRRAADQGAGLRHQDRLGRPRGDAGGDRRHHRAARDRGGAAREPGALPRLHGLRAARRPPARLRRPLPDVQPPDGGADRGSRRRRARPDGERHPPARPRRQQRPASPLGGRDRQDARQRAVPDLQPRGPALGDGDPLPGAERRGQGQRGRHLRRRHHRAQGGGGGAQGLGGAALRDQLGQPGADEHRPPLRPQAPLRQRSLPRALRARERRSRHLRPRRALPRAGGARLDLRRARRRPRDHRLRADAAAHRRPRDPGLADLAADPVRGRAGDRDDLGRPDRAARRPVRGGALARGAAPEREADRARRAARRRRPRAQQPALGRRRLLVDALRDGLRPDDDRARGEDPRRRRALRPHRAHLPRDGPRPAAAARAGDARRSGDGGARPGRLRAPERRRRCRARLGPGAGAGARRTPTSCTRWS